MRRLTLLALLLVTSAAHAGAPDYTITRTVPLGPPDRWDYVYFDARSHRVFIAHSDHTDVVDAGSGTILGKLTGLDGAHGQAVANGGIIWADSGRSARVTAYDPKSFSPIQTLPAGTDADGLITDPSGKIVIVLDGDGHSATVIDAVARQVRATVKLDGAPEFAAADDAHHLYVNIASSRKIAVLDMQTARVTAYYPLPDCQSPHGLAIDAKTRRLFTSCVNTKLQVLDADTGQILQTLPIGRGTDAAAFDPVHHLVFSSNGDGTLSVFRETPTGRLGAEDAVKTAPGARTMATDPQSGRVYLVTADLAIGQPAPVDGRIHYKFAPGTVKLLFLDPAAN